MFAACHAPGTSRTSPRKGVCSVWPGACRAVSVRIVPTSRNARDPLPGPHPPSFHRARAHRAEPDDAFELERILFEKLQTAVVRHLRERGYTGEPGALRATPGTEVRLSILSPGRLHAQVLVRGRRRSG